MSDAATNAVESVNELSAVGKIVRIGRNEQGYRSMTLLIRGVRPMMMEFLFDRLGTSVRIQDYVRVKGYVRAYGYFDEIVKKWTRVQQFIATEVQKEPTDLEKHFQIRGNFVTSTFFRGYFLGEVESLYETGRGWEIITLRVTGAKDARDSHLSLSRFKGSRLASVKLGVGDTICACTSITVREEPKRFENLVVEDLAVISKAEQDEEKENTAHNRRKRTSSEIVDLYEPDQLEDPYAAAEGLSEADDEPRYDESSTVSNNNDEV